MLVGNSYLLISIVEGINLIFINFYLHRNVWNPGPFPENVEPSLSSAGSLPNDSSESNNSSSIRYVSFTNERVEMNKSLDQFSERFYNLHSPNMSLVVLRNRLNVSRQYGTKMVLLITSLRSYDTSVIRRNVTARTERRVSVTFDVKIQNHILFSVIKIPCIELIP